MMAEENKQQKSSEPEKSKKKAIQENDLLSQAGEFLKNPLVTGLGGFFFGYWMASSKYENELKELKEEVRQISKKKKGEKSEGKKKLSEKKKQFRQNRLLQLD